jgi:hypothetical protein
MGGCARPSCPSSPSRLSPRTAYGGCWRPARARTSRLARDTAIVMFLLGTGELADLKGRREGALPYGHKTAVALDRCLRVRVRHKDADLPWLWLGKRGRLTAWASSSSCATGGLRTGQDPRGTPPLMPLLCHLPSSGSRRPPCGSRVT